jgi:hypothetical protein
MPEKYHRHQPYSYVDVSIKYVDEGITSWVARSSWIRWIESEGRGERAEGECKEHKNNDEHTQKGKQRYTPISSLSAATYSRQSLGEEVLIKIVLIPIG